MTGKKNKIHYSLYPLSILYGLGVRFRNQLFDAGLLKSRIFPVPIISVGNITVGGTGKTPHIEYLIRLLSDKYRVAVLSRGYKRKSKGFLIATPGITPAILGDEPFQLWSKFPHIQMAVDADRCQGIDLLMAQAQPPQVILLDDAYQHRYVKPGLSILLSDYNRPIYEDTLLPAGRLREPIKGKHRANILIISKTPPTIKLDEEEQIRQKIGINKNQNLFFSGLAYQSLKNVFDDSPAKLTSESSILLVTGIARPELIEEQIATHYQLYESLVFADHHDFNKSDIQKIKDKFDTISNKQKGIIVTEKDAVRLRHNPFIDDSLKKNIYFLPLEIVFLHNETKRFNQIILDYVAKNQRNG